GDVPPGGEDDAAAGVLAEVVGLHVGEPVDGDVAAGVERNVAAGPHVVVEVGPGRAEPDVPLGAHRDVAAWSREGVAVEGAEDVAGCADGAQTDVAGGVAAADGLSAVGFDQFDAAGVGEGDVAGGHDAQSIQARAHAADGHVTGVADEDATGVCLG